MDVTGSLRNKWPQPKSEIGSLESLYRSVTDGQTLDAQGLYICGVLAHENGRLGEAVTFLGKALCLKPNEISYYIKLGQVCEQAAWLRQASFGFLHAVYLNPRDGETWFRLGRTYAAQNLTVHASTCFQQTLRLNTGHQNARAALNALPL